MLVGPRLTFYQKGVSINFVSETEGVHKCTFKRYKSPHTKRRATKFCMYIIIASINILDKFGGVCKYVFAPGGIHKCTLELNYL